jgi:hypothetical protein
MEIKIHTCEEHDTIQQRSYNTAHMKGEPVSDLQYAHMILEFLSDL